LFFGTIRLCIIHFIDECLLHPSLHNESPNALPGQWNTKGHDRL